LWEERWVDGVRVIVVPEYRGYRIQVDAVAVDGRWNADVRLRRLFTEDKPQLEPVTCRKLTPDNAERSAEIWAMDHDGQRGE